MKMKRKISLPQCRKEEEIPQKYKKRRKQQLLKQLIKIKMKKNRTKKK